MRHGPHWAFLLFFLFFLFSSFLVAISWPQRRLHQHIGRMTRRQLIKARLESRSTWHSGIEADTPRRHICCGFFSLSASMRSKAPDPLSSFAFVFSEKDNAAFLSGRQRWKVSWRRRGIRANLNLHPDEGHDSTARRQVVRKSHRAVAWPQGSEKNSIPCPPDGVSWASHRRTHRYRTVSAARRRKRSGSRTPSSIFGTSKISRWEELSVSVGLWRNLVQGWRERLTPSPRWVGNLSYTWIFPGLPQISSVARH